MMSSCAASSAKSEEKPGAHVKNWFGASSIPSAGRFSTVPAVYEHCQTAYLSGPRRVHLAASRCLRDLCGVHRLLPEPQSAGNCEWAFLSHLAAACIPVPIVRIGDGFGRHVASVVQRYVYLSRGLGVVGLVYALAAMVYTGPLMRRYPSMCGRFLQWSRLVVMRVLLVVSLGIAEEAKAYLLPGLTRSLRSAHAAPRSAAFPSSLASVWFAS